MLPRFFLNLGNLGKIPALSVRYHWISRIQPGYLSRLYKYYSIKIFSSNQDVKLWELFCFAGDEMGENRLVDMEDQEMGSNTEEDTTLEAEATWTESSAANAYFQPQSQTDGTYWGGENYMYGAGDWCPMIYSELAEIHRQVTLLIFIIHKPI